MAPVSFADHVQVRGFVTVSSMLSMVASKSTQHRLIGTYVGVFIGK